MTMEAATKMDLASFYALADRLLKNEHRRFQANMFGVKAAVDAFWHGKESKGMESFVKAFPSQDADVKAAPAGDRNPDGTQKSNMDGFRALARMAGQGKK